MFLTFVNFILCAEREDYVFGVRSDFSTENPCMFNDHQWIWSGQKLYMNQPIGGVSNAIKFTANSKSEAEEFFKEKLANMVPRTSYRRSSANAASRRTTTGRTGGRGSSSGGRTGGRTGGHRGTGTVALTEAAKNVIAKLKYPRFRIATNLMQTYEQDHLVSGPGGGRGRVNREYTGRYFEIKTAFISCKKKGETYDIVYVPYTVSLVAKTFLWDRAHWNYVTGERVFDKKRANDKKYINEVYNYVKTGKKMIDAPYPVLISTQNIEKIYERLSPLVALERERFQKLPY